MIGTALIIIGSIMLSCIAYAAGFAIGYDKGISNSAALVQALEDEQKWNRQVQVTRRGDRTKGTFAIRNEQTNTILSTGN